MTIVALPIAIVTSWFLFQRGMSSLHFFFFCCCCVYIEKRGGGEREIEEKWADVGVMRGEFSF